MKHAVLLCTLMLCASAWAAGPKTNFVDHSNDLLISKADAKAVMGENIPDKVWKIYPASKYAFLSQVEGGRTPSGTCVVTARVMVMTLTPTVRAVLFRPQKTATAFEALPGATSEQCRALAKDKLKDATIGVVSSIVKL